MKRLLVFPTFLLVCISLFSQKPQTPFHTLKNVALESPIKFTTYIHHINNLRSDKQIKLDSIIGFDNNGGGQLVPESIQKMTYDSEGKNLTYSLSDPLFTPPSLIYKYSITYDLEDRIQQVVIVNPDLTGGLDSLRYLNTYDAMGRLTTNTFQRKDEVVKSWINTQRSEYTYNTINEMDTVRLFFWANSTNEWEFHSLEAFMYDNNDLLIQTLEYDYDPNTDMLIPYYKYDIERNSRGLNVVLTGSVWNEVELEWSLESKTERTYNAQDQLIEIRDFNYSSAQWVNEDRELYSYDAESDFNSVTFEYWDESVNEFIPEYSNIFFYDKSYSFEDLAFQEFPFLEAPNDRRLFYQFKVDKIIFEESATGNRDDFVSYYWSQLNSSSANQVAAKELLLFPNPVKDIIEFSTQIPKGSWRVFNLNGVEVLSGVDQNSNGIYVRDLAPGLYTVRVEGKDTSHIGTFVKL